MSDTKPKSQARAYYFRLALRAALKCASTDPGRPSLRGVWLGKDCVEASDGRRLIRVWWPDGNFERLGFVRDADARRYVAWMRHDEKLQSAGFEQPSETLLPLTGAVEKPDTARLWAEKRSAPVKSVWVNPAFVATLETVWKILQPNMEPCMRLEVAGEHEPLYAEMKPDLFRVEYLLMPMRAR